MASFSERQLEEILEYVRDNISKRYWEYDDHLVSQTKHPSTSRNITTLCFTPNTTSGTWTKEYRAIIGGGDIYSSGAQNDYADYIVHLQKGTWTLTLLHHKEANRGIYTITVDHVNRTAGTTSIATIDGYNAGSADNQFDTSGSFTINDSGLHTIRFKMASKNAAATAYYAVITWFTLIRTSSP